MIELRNSKTTELGRSKDGRRRFAVDSRIGAVQMLDPEKGWQDINPVLVRDKDSWHIEGAPYYAEVRDDGSRLFCPDKYEKSKYLEFKPHRKLNGEASLKSNQSVLGKSSIHNELVYPADFGSFSFLFTNTGMYLPLMLESSIKIDGKSVDRLTFDIDATLDVESLLKAGSAVGILPARLGDELMEWSYKNGQLEFGFDLTGKEFPLKLIDAIDVDVSAGADDGYYYASGASFNNSLAYAYLCNLAGVTRNAFYRFDGITIPQGSTVDVCSITINAAKAGSPLSKVYLEKANDPDAVLSAADGQGRTRTTAGVDWDADWTGTAYRQSPSLIAPAQELVDAYGFNNQAWQVLHDDDGSSATYNYIQVNTYENGTPPGLYIEYTEGGSATEKFAAEAASGTEASFLAAVMVKTESGSGQDNNDDHPAARLYSGENGTGVDAESSPVVYMAAGGETGNAVDIRDEYCPVIMPASESALGIDVSLFLDVLLDAIETGSATEMAGLIRDTVELVALDNGSGIEGVIARLLGAAEAGVGMDMAETIAEIVRSDGGTGIDMSWVTLVTSDSGLSSELGTLFKTAFSGDKGAGSEVLRSLLQAAGAVTDMRLPRRAGSRKIPSQQQQKPSARRRMPSKGVNL